MARQYGTTSGLVDVTTSMIIVDPNAFPVNLGKTQGEDSPESSFRVVAYNGQNVLPTALGYKSYFADSSKFNLEAIPSDFCQIVIAYQTPNFSVMLFAFCEEGIYYTNATETESTAWTLIGATGRDPATTQIRYLWTTTVIANKLIAYNQGAAEYWLIADLATISNAIASTAIPDATITSVLESIPLQFGIATVVPNFINMAGQIGIFRADTRLGMWDSDNSVAWSSSFYLWDFKPSVKNFAGNTTFADVQGQITKILGQGNGFIIYAGKSVVRVTPLQGSPERWQGNALLSDVGVVFDTQACAGQPDDIHFAMTSSGLAQISGGEVTFIQTEVSDYLSENSDVVALSYIDGRYLFLQTTSDLVPSKLETNTQQVSDKEGNFYTFPVPQPVEPDADYLEYLQSLLDSANEAAQQEFTDSQEPVDDPAATVPEGLRLVPCWDGHEFDTNVDNSIIPSSYNATGTVYVPSAIIPGYEWPIPIRRKAPVYGTAFGTDTRFFDKAGDEYAAILKDNTQRIKETTEICLAAATTFLQAEGDDSFGDFLSATGPLTAPVGAHTSDTYEDIAGWKWIRSLAGTELVARASDCNNTLFPKICDYDYTIDARIIENVDIYPWLPRLGTVANSTVFHSVRTITDGVEEWSELAGWLDLINIQTSEVGAMPLNAFSASVMSALYNQSFTANQIATGPFTKRAFVAGSASTDTTYGVYKFLIDETMYENVWSPLSVTAAGLSFPGFIVSSYEVDTSNPALTKCGTPRLVDSPDAALTNQVFSQPFMWDTHKSASNYITYQYQETHYESPPGTCDTVNWYVDYEWAYKVDKTFIWLNSTDEFSTVPAHYTLEQKIAINDLATAAAANYLPKRVRVYPAGGGFTIMDRRYTVDYSDYTPTDQPEVFEAEVSGYGYYPAGGFSFRKTHSRSLSNPCSPTPATLLAYTTEDDAGGLTTSPSLELDFPPLNSYPWPYPDPVPFPDIYALFRKGSAAPFYPMYEAACFYDTQLKKWGRYSNKHSLITNLLPVNRVDLSTLPVPDRGIRGGSLDANNRLTIFNDAQSQGFLTYGRLGSFRKGHTVVNGVVLRFAKPAYCNVICEISMDGSTVDPTLSVGTMVDGLYNVEIPFTVSCKWFNIIVQGNFNLVGLSYLSQARSRR